MNKLSTREKIMIYGLVLLIIGAVGICLVILPTIDKVAVLNEELQKVEEEKTAQETVIAASAGYEQQISDNQVLVTERGNEFYVPLAGEDLDTLFQTLLSQYNLKCTKIAFGDTGYRGVMNYSEMLASDASFKDDASGDTTAASGNDPGYSYSAYLSGNEVVLSGLGSEADVKRFAASFADNIAIKLVSIVWKKGYSATEFTAAFEVYMFDSTVAYTQIQPTDETPADAAVEDAAADTAAEDTAAAE